MPKTYTIPIPSDGPYLSTDINEGQLPELLERAMRIAQEPQQQDMLLFSTLTAVSYALPHMKMLHGIEQHTYYPHLMTLIIAPPASGKGLMKNARRLLEPIDYELHRFEKTAFIPANSSSTAFIDLLKANGGTGFMIDTEMDILAKIWKKDYGDYSDLFRQAYEHEPFSKARRVGKSATLSFLIQNPRLSVLLSGTPNQVRPLLGTGEDGLASRFLPYIISDVMPFDRAVLMNGDHYKENSAAVVFDELGQELLKRWQWLSSQDHDCLWSLTDEQAEALGDVLEDFENLAFEPISNPATGEVIEMPVAFKHSFNRMVVTIKRIGLILSALRMDMTTLPQVLYCSDEDFKTLILFAEKLLKHAAQLLRILPEQQPLLPLQKVERTAKMRMEDFLSQLPVDFTIKDAYEVGNRFGVTERTVKNHLKAATDDKKIIRLSVGKYRKL